MPEKPHKAAMPETDVQGNVYGNKDEKKEASFPLGWLDRVVVKQYNVYAAPSGQVQVDEGTIRIMPYEVESFEALQKNDNQGFGDLHYKILHDPR